LEAGNGWRQGEKKGKEDDEENGKKLRRPQGHLQNIGNDNG
jgi:hypothetical protein